MLGDTCFNEQNIHAQCKLHFRVQGFPAGIHIDQVHEALRQAKWNVIVQRVLHMPDLALALVASDSAPPSPRILTSVATLHIDEAVRRPRAISQSTSTAQAYTPQSSQGSSSDSPAFPAVPRSFLPSKSQGSLMTPIAANISSRADSLEQQLARVTNELETVKTEQKNTSARLDDIAKSQDRGFSQLMNAITDLKNESSSPAIPSPHHPANILDIDHHHDVLKLFQKKS